MLLVERASLIVALSILLACAAACAADRPDEGSEAGDAGPGDDDHDGDDDTPTGAADAATGGGEAPTSFSCDLQAGTCFDPATGLTWERAPAAATYTWVDAKAHCAALPLAGGGWRLPKIQELRSIISGCPNTALGGACMASDPDCAVRACMAGCDQCPSTIVNGQVTCFWPEALAGSCDGAHWSVTAYADSIDPGAWYVDFGHGAFVHGWLASQPLHARCVR